MTAPIEFFRCCPKCGQPVRRVGTNAIQCSACGFLYHFNPAVAVGALVVNDEGRMLWIRRAKEPGKGKLGLPGGFVDVGETAEEALRREVREEVNLELDSLEFLCTCANQYPYGGVTYPVLDLFYAARARAAESAAALEDVESFCWLKPQEVRPDEIAFPSVKVALSCWLGRTGARA
ncbi:MAG: NUDIX domain-containing protein [Verrucomicrobia bacterium]|nr:NUDIX domain-containing protein [Verrucomicrobiota bacterium]